MSPRTKHNLIQLITFIELGVSIYVFYKFNLFGIQESLEKGTGGYGFILFIMGLNIATVYLLEKAFNHKVKFWAWYVGRKGRSDEYFSRVRVVVLLVLVLFCIMAYIQIFNVKF